MFALAFRAYFQKFGPIVECKIMKDKEGLYKRSPEKTMEKIYPLVSR